MKHLTSKLTLSLFVLSFSAQSFAWPLSNEYYQGKLLEWANNRNQELQTRPAVSDTVSVDTLSDDEKYVRFNVPLAFDLTAPLQEEPSASIQEEMKKTSALYQQIFGRDSLKSFLWSGIETGNTLTSNMDYRWNSIREAGLYDPAIRKKFIEGLRKTGIRNLRFGFSNHEIERISEGEWVEESWKNASDMINDFVEAGIDLSLDLHHFGIESQFCVDSNLQRVTYLKAGEELCDKLRYDPTKSFYLHPDWPEYFADFAHEVVKRFYPKVKAFTLINEPETVKGFNSGLWFGAFPGWGPNRISYAPFFETYRAINLGLAAVKARLKIEEHVRGLKSSQRPIFFHVEAMVPKMTWPEFNGYIRYISSDTILGHDWLMNADFDFLKRLPFEQVGNYLNWDAQSPDKRTVLHMLASQSIWWGFNGDRRGIEERTSQFLNALQELKNEHLKLKRRFGLTMRSYTMLGIDYYSHNEEGLEPKPELYIQQIKDGKRIGFYETAKSYFERYQMPMMVTETGTPYFVYGARWHQQMLLESAKLMKSGIPFLGYTVFPAIDTYGWEHAVSRPKEPLYRPEGSLYNPSGIFYLTTEPPVSAEIFGWKPMEPKDFIFELKKELLKTFK